MNICHALEPCAADESKIGSLDVKSSVLLENRFIKFITVCESPTQFSHNTDPLCLTVALKFTNAAKNFSHRLYVIVIQVQNMSQSIEVLDQRTQRDLKFVETMEVQLKSLENKFKEVEDGHESNIARQYKVSQGF